MKNITFTKIFLNFITLFTVLSFTVVLAQTSGLIYEPTAGDANIVLDSKNDDYTLLTRFDFTIDDQLQSAKELVLFYDAKDERFQTLYKTSADKMKSNKVTALYFLNNYRITTISLKPELFILN